MRYLLSIRKSVYYIIRHNKNTCSYKLKLNILQPYLGNEKTKMWLCVTRRLRSAWAPDQSEKRLCCPHKQILCLESSLDAHSFCWFCHDSQSRILILYILWIHCVDNIRIYYEFEGSLEKSVPRITVWHYEACRDYKNL